MRREVLCAKQKEGHNEEPKLENFDDRDCCDARLRFTGFKSLCDG